MAAKNIDIKIRCIVSPTVQVFIVKKLICYAFKKTK